MKVEFENLITAYRNPAIAANKAALATIVKVKGSSYRRPGARMLIVDNGNWTGAISGGCLERDALRKALSVMLQDKARIVTYDTTDEDDNAFGIGLGCNGIINVLMEPLHRGETGNPLELLEQLLANKQKAVMATLFGSGDSGQRKIYRSDGSTVSTITRPGLEQAVDTIIIEVLRNGQSRVIEIEPEQFVLVEVLEPDIQLLVFGAGYDAVPLIRMGKLAGCHITLVNDNPNHLNSPRFTDADSILYSPAADTLRNVQVTAYSAAVLLSHNYNYDQALLTQLLQTNIRYIGLLGPSKKKLRLLDAIGITEEKDLKRIYNPVGLDIGAETPEEIALSIIAEIKAVFNGRNGQMLRFKDGPIHE